MGTDDELFQDAAADLLGPSGVRAVGHLADCLHVEVLRGARVDLGELQVLALDGERAMGQAVAPFRMTVPQPQHVELVVGLVDDFAPSSLIAQGDHGASGVAGSGLPFDGDGGGVDLVQAGRARSIAGPDRPAVPRQTGGVIVAVEEEASGGKVGRGPDPIELRRLRGH